MKSHPWSRPMDPAEARAKREAELRAMAYKRDERERWRALGAPAGRVRHRADWKPA